MAQELTMRGKVFKAYAEAVIARHGFGSNKMVKPGSPDFIEQEKTRADRLIKLAGWAQESTSMDLEKFEAAISGGEEGKRICRELAEAEKWLIENGWLREYSFDTSNRVAGTGGRVYCNLRVHTRIGVTPKGWAVARKYIDA